MKNKMEENRGIDIQRQENTYPTTKEDKTGNDKAIKLTIPNEALKYARENNVSINITIQINKDNCIQKIGASVINLIRKLL